MPRIALYDDINIKMPRRYDDIDVAERLLSPEAGINGQRFGERNDMFRNVK